MKNSLLITQLFPPDVGGVQNYLYNICQNLPPDKTFIFSSLLNKGEIKKVFDFDQSQPFKIYRDKNTSIYKKIHLTPVHIYKEARKIVKKHNIEFIQAGHLYPQGVASLLLKKRLKLPYLIYLYGLEFLEIKNFSKFKAKLVISALKNADHIIVIANFLKEKLIKYGIPEKRIIKIMPGVDFNYFKPELNTSDLKIKHNLENKKIILTCGRLVKRKNHQLVINALPEILKKVPNAIYLIAGIGPEEENLKNQVRELNLENSVKFLGEVNNKDLPIYYNLADMFCMPSIYNKKTGDIEGFGIVFIEAQACSTPTIGGNTGGIPDAIKNNIDGFLVNPKSCQDLAKKITKLLLNNNLAQQFGKAGREKVMKKHNWSKLVEKLPL